MNDDVVIRANGLGKAYQIYDRPLDRLKQSLWRGRKQFHREFHALQGVSFEIRRGEAVGIIGRNGSGKSTLLQLIAGTLTPSQGHVEVNGRLAALLELGSGFNPEFTGRENVFMNGALLGLSQDELSARYEEIIEFAGIGEFIDQPVKTYSSGMVVRLAFSVSVCVDPEILIVDEALSVGDMAFQVKCMERLDYLTKSGTTLLYVSHDIASVKAFCQRAIYLEKGEVRGIGLASDMVERYLLDVRNLTRNEATQGRQFAAKATLGSDQTFSFGTDQGRVTHAAFVESGTTQWACMTGEMVTVEAAVEFDGSLNVPTISLVVHDHRMIDLFGRYFPIDASAGSDGRYRAKVRMRFRAGLNGGTYFLTLRLEDRPSEHMFLPVDKQTGVLQLRVTRPFDQHFIGMTDTPIAYEPCLDSTTEI